MLFQRKMSLKQLIMAQKCLNLFAILLQCLSKQWSKPFWRPLFFFTSSFGAASDAEIAYTVALNDSNVTNFLMNGIIVWSLFL